MVGFRVHGSAKCVCVRIWYMRVPSLNIARYSILYEVSRSTNAVPNHVCMCMYVCLCLCVCVCDNLMRTETRQRHARAMPIVIVIQDWFDHHKAGLTGWMRSVFDVYGIEFQNAAGFAHFKIHYIRTHAPHTSEEEIRLRFVSFLFSSYVCRMNARTEQSSLSYFINAEASGLCASSVNSP